VLTTTYKILSNILVTSIPPYENEITGDKQCEFCNNRSTTDQIFCIFQTPEKKWKYNGTLH